MQVTKGTWRMREQCVPGSLSSSPAQEPGNEANSRYEPRPLHKCLGLPQVSQKRPRFCEDYKNDNQLVD